MADYSIYQGPVPEWEEFVRATNYVNASLEGVTPEQLREATNAARIQASRALISSLGLNDSVIWHDYSILTRDQQNIIARVYRPRHLEKPQGLPVFLHFHGGGFLYGNVESEDSSCARIVAACSTPVMVINVNYRHTPEYKHPTAHNDAWDSFEWLSENISALGGDPNRVIVGGVSAGGCLAASIALRYAEDKMKDMGQPSSSSSPYCTIQGQVLCIPWLVHPAVHPSAAATLSSFNQNQMAPVLPAAALTLFANLLGDAAKLDPYFNVALAPDETLAHSPKSAFLIAGQDLLRDEGLYFAEKLKKNGIPTKTAVFPGLPHGFRRFPELRSTARWEELIVESLEWCLCDDTTSTFRVERVEYN
ncbi:uncharacterized protein Z519_02187 [Cladophialophora bantiana CBS 173.52]|uniref:Alpha/beta hydrolase fold-3 domain-containing protein n=1 Tax=Cladophialophora bantiana (strain ATCC 10958 / CBS 173.52 / CDC B-1940 / NIH 8579) TaxID=1442370 RepID=A0A0D2F3G1_CLAB1|nr:uncharacterized protein Z519_02187 [Cladophialophora bantiana CBS 173.52]KIW96796.1 hypothetical protein Z519_02187 [Cladophialophora bantiana CBS 173.52]